jgi:hypothetical protein
MSPARISSNTPHRQSFRIGFGLKHKRQHRGNEDDLLNAVRTVPSDVARDFAASGRVTDKCSLTQIERFDHGS